MNSILAHEKTDRQWWIAMGSRNRDTGFAFQVPHAINQLDENRKKTNQEMKEENRHANIVNVLWHNYLHVLF